MNHNIRPKIRNIIQPTLYQGEPIFLVRDNLKLARIYEFPRALVPLATFCDGRHTIPEIEFALKVRYGLQMSQPVIENLLNQFDQVLLLDSDTFQQAKQQILSEYRAAPYRKAALAGASYPADRNDLRNLFKEYLAGADDVALSPAGSRAIISPHIDYQRGGAIYAQVWASAAEAVRQAELVIILGTDHHGGYGTLTLSPQNYASPLGVMPTDKELVDRLAGILGPDKAFAEELHHRDEWSIELDLVWLQYMRDGQPCPVLPILCGSFHHFMLDKADITQEARFQAFIDLLREEMAQRRTLIVASGDLAHMGPAFDGPPLDAKGYEQMKADDTVLLDTLGQGQAGNFFEFMKAGQYERNVCGLSPFYFTLRLLNESEGQLIAYDRCPADNQNTSYVSVCGMVFS